jgi:hypothetical protein
LKGERDKALAFAREIIPNDPELKALYPTLVLEALGQDLASQATDSDIAALKGGSEFKAMESEALKQLCDLDPGNVCYWNRWAKHCVEQHLKKEGRRAFDVIGENWDESVWHKKAEFDKAKKEIL